MHGTTFGLLVNWKQTPSVSLTDQIADTRSQGCTDPQSLENAWIWTLLALHQCLDLHIVGIE